MKRLSNRSRRSSSSLTWWDTLTYDNRLMIVIFAFSISASELYYLFMYIKQGGRTLLDALLEGACVGALVGIILFPLIKVIGKVFDKVSKK